MRPFTRGKRRRPNSKEGSGERWKKVVGIGMLSIVAIGGGAWTVAQDATAEAEDSTESPTAARTAAVVEQDIVEYLELDGTLTFDASTTWSSSTDGTVTWIADEGTVIERGNTIAELDDSPIVLFYGDTPPYRPLSQGVSEGDDVAELEENLVALGYDEDYNITIDGVYNSATSDAVREWQEDIGVEVTGTVSPGSYVVASGSVHVQSVLAELGARVRIDSPLIAAVSIASERLVVSPVAGIVVSSPSQGDAVETGDIVLEIADVAVPAIVGTEPMERSLADGDEGADVEQLENALVGLGYDAEGDLEVDDVFDEATAAAVADWEKDLDIEEDGIVQIDQIVVVPPGTTVSESLVEIGDEVAVGEPIFVSRISQRIVTTQIDVVDQGSVAIGDQVSVELADGTLIDAVVAAVGSVAISSPTDPDADPFVEVDLAIAEGDAPADLVESPVEVLVVDSIAENATVVPASALIALREGGFAIEVVTGGATQLVGVETGEFADGFVEVTGDGIVAGVEVVVP